LVSVPGALPVRSRSWARVAVATNPTDFPADSDYDAVEDPVDRKKLEALFFDKGRAVYRCGQCGRLMVEWDRTAAVTFYEPVAKKEEADPGGRKEADDRLLAEKEAQAEAEYAALYESVDTTARYSETKEAFYTAISLARKMGREADARRLEERLQAIKEIFRHQFPGS
jgi:hypothetical protein